MVGLAELMRATRKWRGLTQRELAQRMGVHINTVVNMEQQPDRILLGTFSKAAAALEVDEWRILRRLAKSQCNVDRLAVARVTRDDAVENERK